MIAIVEEIVTDLTSRAAELLELMSVGTTITAAEIAEPTGDERRAPAVKVEHQQGLL